ncbi:MAG: hypothetical protein BGP08_18865 [Rhizobiales bacterium 64-17]|nr:MAG: hypothetical protein BGP08_18865 [Rhizobiales bacterium 64-17]
MYLVTYRVEVRWELSRQRGADDQGMVSSTLLTLVVIPATFGLIKGFQSEGPHGPTPPSPQTPTTKRLSRILEPAE